MLAIGRGPLECTCKLAVYTCTDKHGPSETSLLRLVFAGDAGGFEEACVEVLVAFIRVTWEPDDNRMMIVGQRMI